MPSSPVRGQLAILKRTWDEFNADDCMQQAAALAYYTAFSLPPLLMLLLLIAGAVWDPADVQGAIERQISTFMGPAGAAQVRSILANVEQPGTGGAVGTAASVGALVFGATGAFVQLQSSLNRAWEVKPDPRQGGVKNFLLKRLFSFGMVLAVAFLLIVSLVLSALLSAFGDLLGRMLPEGFSATVLQLINLGLSVVVFSAIFATMFKVLPDAVVGWRDVIVGALVTTLLFAIGRFIISFYLGRSDPGSAYGAAGSLVIILVWIYYSAIILLIGAEYTQAWAEAHGRKIEPEPGAVRVVVQEKRLEAKPAEEKAEKPEKTEAEKPAEKTS
ncbi:MAG TPA: YihY/virulence factor BrkB family protein [Gemmatimonadaceae bacterium]|nr:YihY/virulence factor BrkB family protein [Gemmatimonadaceae bacterium]